MQTSNWARVAVTAGLVVAGAFAVLTPGAASASPGDDAIDRVTITLKPARVTIEMTSGATCEPTLRRPFTLPPAGSYFGNKSPGNTLIVRLRGRRRWTLTFVQPPSQGVCAAVRSARGRFLVEVWATPADAAAAEHHRGQDTGRSDGRDESAERAGTPDAHGGAGGAGHGSGSNDPNGPSDPTAAGNAGRTGGTTGAATGDSTATGELARVRRRARAIARADRGAASIARKVNRGDRITYAEALALVDAKLGDIAREQSGHSSKTDWEQWAQFLLANRDKLTGHVRVDRNAMSLDEVQKLLADYKQHARIVDPPSATGTELQSQLAVDPVLIESWNNLESWERAMWKAYWRKLPDATQDDRAVRVRDLRLTQRVRFHIALQSSVDYMGAGFREAARALFNDRTFMAVVVGGITIYAIAILLPEPLFSKVTAAAITTFLLASSFTLSEIIDVVKAWFRLRKNAGRARSMAALDAAARDFGTSIGGAGCRILLTLFTYFAGRALPAPKVGAPVGPAGGVAVTGGGGGAAAAALPRVAFIGGTRLVVLENGAVIIAPAAMAAVTAGGASSGGGGPPSSGSTDRATNVKGGGKNGRKSNAKRQDALRQQLEEAQQKLRNARTNKEKKSIKAIIRHLRLKMRQSEPHAINPERH